MKWYDPDTQGKTEVQVEGKYYYIYYRNQKEFEGKRSDLQVSRNYSNAMKKIGGKVHERREDHTYMKTLKGTIKRSGHMSLLTMATKSNFESSKKRP